MTKARLWNLNDTARELWERTVENEVLSRVPAMAMLMERKRIYFWKTCPRLADWTKMQTPVVYTCASAMPGDDARQIMVSCDELEALIEATQANVRKWLQDWLEAWGGNIDRGARLVIHPKRKFLMTPFCWHGPELSQDPKDEMTLGIPTGWNLCIARILLVCRLTQGPGRCWVCGCTDVHPCLDVGTGRVCHWVEDDLCSACEARAHGAGVRR